jgi:bifunctional non-homologous end joining protein LigD
MPAQLVVRGSPLDRSIRWVKPELIAEVQFTDWTSVGGVRQATYLGLREDKLARQVVREPPDPAGTQQSSPPASTEAVRLTHPTRELWPGITKQDLAEYWRSVADAAVPELTHRPLAIVRCPSGIEGERFFQKHGHGRMPLQIREGRADRQPYLAIDGLEGLLALTQMDAIELHPWGASETDPLHPDRLVFDLDPGDGVELAEVVRAARDVHTRLESLGLQSFCRTTGGKGLHVVVPILPEVGWDEVRDFCKSFAETLSKEQPERFLSTVRKADRKGRILLDWLRNGAGATAIASYCPRARPGATVATPVTWREVNARLNPRAFTLQSVPQRLKRLRKDPWEGFSASRQHLPPLSQPRPSRLRRK